MWSGMIVPAIRFKKNIVGYNSKCPFVDYPFFFTLKISTVLEEVV